MFTWLKSFLGLGSPIKSGPKATYESARTTPENRNHWRHASNAAVSVIQDAPTREKIRSRVRFEDANDSHFTSLIDARANSTIGATGPKLQIRIPGREEDARKVELAWERYLKRVQFVDRLRLMDYGETRCGESFALFVSDPSAPPNEPQLDLKLIETDQVSSPSYDPANPYAFDGGVVDDLGRVTEWHVLRTHPGSGGWKSISQEFDRYPASQIIQFHTPRRIGQLRGISPLQSTLPTQSTLRRYEAAVVSSAETQSRVTALMTSDSELPDTSEAEDDPQTIVPMEEVHLGQTNFLAVPAGYDIKFPQATQPGSNHSDFTYTTRTGIGRPIGAPAHISTGDASRHNYSSARAETELWGEVNKIRRTRIESLIVERVFSAWYAEAVLIVGYLPANLPPLEEWNRKYRWPRMASLDSTKDAEAAQTELEAGITTFEKVCADRGEDFEDVFRQRALEMRLMKELGISPSSVPSPAKTPGREVPAEDEDTELEDMDETEIEEETSDV